MPFSYNFVVPEVDVDRIPFFDAFLSYASADRDAVESLARQLLDRGNDVFFDSWFIQPGQNIPKVLLTALRKSHRVVAVMSPEYFHSRWTEFELNWNFVETQLAPAGAESVVIPALLRACEVPRELRSLRRVDLTVEKSVSGFEELVSALSRRLNFSIESYVVVRNDTHYLSEFVAAKVERFFGFPVERIHDFMLVYDELVQNAFAHVSDAHNRVEVTIRADGGQIRLEVSDSGFGFDLAADKLMPLNLQTREETSVRGLKLVQPLCDRISNQMRHGRHVVTAVLNKSRVHVRELASLSEIDPSPAAVLAWRLDGSRNSFRRFVDATGHRAYLLLPMGPIRLDNADLVAENLESVAAYDYVIVDACDVSYVDSRGLRVFVDFWSAMRRRGATVAIASSHRLTDLFVISKLSVAIKILTSREEALREFSATN